MVWYGMVWYSMIWDCIVWCGMGWDCVMLFSCLFQDNPCSWATIKDPGEIF